MENFYANKFDNLDDMEEFLDSLTTKDYERTNRQPEYHVY